MKLGGIYVSVGAKTSKLKRDLAKAKGMTEKTAVLMKKAISNISFAKVGVAVAAFSAAYVYGMKKAIDAASDLQEVQGKFDVVFKEHREQAEDMAKVLVDAYAMSTREAKQYMSSIQDLLVPMGMMSDKALLMSNEVVKLAADLGSFNNLPTATVMLDIQSALVGNFETMKKYGVILNETVIKQKALEMGLWSGKGMVDANTKAQIAYKLMLEGSAAAIGDQERTMGSYANQMKKLKANVEDIAAAIGDELLPQVTAWVNRLNEMIKQNPQIIKDIGEFAEKTLALAETMATATYKVLSFGKAVLEVTGILGMLEHATMIGRYGASGSWMEEGEEALNKYNKALKETTKETNILIDSWLRYENFNIKLTKDKAAAISAAAKAFKDAAADRKKAAQEDMADAEAMAAVYQRQFDVQKQYYVDSLSAKDKYNQMMLDFDMELRDLELQGQIDHAQKMAEIAKSKIKSTVSLFESLASLMGQFNIMMSQMADAGAKRSKSDFERQKKFQIAQAVMSTAAAVANTLAQWPWTPARIIEATITSALGHLQVATIDKQEYAYAKGDIFTNSIVDRPTMFNNSVMGEKGPEAIMPLARGPGGELGVKATGQSGGTTIINNNVMAMDSQSVSEVLRRNPNAITTVVSQEIQRGNSSLNANIRRVSH